MSNRRAESARDRDGATKQSLEAAEHPAGEIPRRFTDLSSDYFMETVIVPLPRRFFQPGAAIVARRLLGHFLIRNTPSGLCGGPIVETEAYLQDDPACHAYAGQTQRNRSMFGPPGRAYVYFIYGNHYCVNAVCRPAGCAEAVLIRAAEAAWGRDRMLRHRSVVNVNELTNGPAKLCQAMAIDRRLDGVDLCDARSALFLARNACRGRYIKAFGPVVATVRVGLRRAADLPLRFCLSRSEWLSRKVLT